MADVLILLAAYNGAEYIRQQLDSILAQDHADWHLVLSDDGSSDETPEILAEYAPDAPVWSETLGQWQTHPALDIAGSPGEAVYACRD